MMSEIAEIKLAGGGSLFVETEDVAIPAAPALAATGRKLPEEGAEEVGAREMVRDTLQLLHDTLKPVAEAVHEAFLKAQPDEWGMELNIGFKGKTNPIPVIVSGEASVAIKIKATWKK
ncbi:MAG: hypothetical protein HY789_06725 [Deltaproteobacteria bacterium]|nr:hypothetical protein [Deltaproteobacteria bacterium]